MVWIRRTLIGLAVVVLLAVVGGALAGTAAVRRSFPMYDGERSLAILDASVEVVRDDHGVPTIHASTPDDLFRAQGYVHAQDRFFEMDFRRHVTAGRLSELFGDGQVATDRFVRTLGWRRVAEAEVERLDRDTLAALEAYAEGVNAWVRDRRGSELSLEHALLPLTGARGYVPEPWTPADSVAWLKAMAWDLRSNLEAELERGRLLAVLDRGQVDTLYPPFPYDRHAPIIGPDHDEAGAGAGGPDGTAAPTAGGEARRPEPAVATALAEADAALARGQGVVADLPGLLGPVGEGLGSNSWVLAPERSATGGALLANDPHLGPSQPSLWYQVGLRCRPVTEDCPYQVTGFSFAGFPGVIIGHNDRIAWGLTNLGADVTDLFVERVDGDRYLTEDGWTDLEVHTETIHVAGGEPVEITVRRSRHGPLLSDVSDDAAELADGPLVEGSDGPEHAVALAWTALEPGRTADAVLPLNRAADFDDFRAAARRFEVPSQNLVYADVDGHIGYQAPGRIPIRDGFDGTYPVPGWTGEHRWVGEVDVDDLPWLLDPYDGQIVTANQVVGPDAAVFLRADVDANAGYRAQRIRDLLGDRDDLDLDDLAAIQTDEHNGNAEHLVPYLLDVEVPDEVAAAQALLADWDLQDAADSAPAAFFNATWRHLLALTFHPELPEWAWPSGGGRWWEVVRDLTSRPDDDWWDDPTTPGRETRDDVLRYAMVDAHAELVDRLGADESQWRWGQLHQLTLTHQSFGESGIGPVERVFNRGPLELGGGSDIVNATGWTAHVGYEVDWVPSMRFLVDLADLDAGRWIHLTGQSGRPFHSHYTDQAERWRDGAHLRLVFSDAAVDAAATRRLLLEPG